MSLRLPDVLGILLDEMRQPELGMQQQRKLDAVLAARTFNGTAPIRVTELPDEGFLLKQ